jgi:hypothetical protein
VLSNLRDKLDKLILFLEVVELDSMILAKTKSESVLTLLILSKIRSNCHESDINYYYNCSVSVFLSTQVYAASSTGYAFEALEHAEEAEKHGKMGHSKELLEHAKKSLEHAQAASKGYAEVQNNEAHKNMDEAIKHAEMNHADVATKHTEQAIELIRKARR